MVTSISDIHPPRDCQSDHVLLFGDVCDLWYGTPPEFTADKWSFIAPSLHVSESGARDSRSAPFPAV